ncbi:hypothetical protein Nmel_008740, partial [Mimus melanotis]
MIYSMTLVCGEQISAPFPPCHPTSDPSGVPAAASGRRTQPSSGNLAKTRSRQLKQKRTLMSTHSLSEQEGLSPVLI